MDLQIGETIYIFDGNFRVYPKDGGACIYSEHFRPYTIVSETDKEYVCDYGIINKRSGMFKRNPRYKPQHIFTEAQKNDSVFQQAHSYKISEDVRRLDATMLRKVAELIGYKG
ncbi:MAG: hypothetical protein M0R06_11530 [Sphaerochaeta sp.]|jgi:hypothetical protein|nr:hypothetical protein [Sphaerochaeta sp.]